jgi:hypothetical protein
MGNKFHSGVVLGVAMCYVLATVVLADPFSACPTYALSSSDLTNRPTSGQYDRLIEDFNWCYRGLRDRYTVTHNAGPTNVYTGWASPPWTNGVKWVVEDLWWLREKTRNIISGFVNHDGAPDFADTSAIPMYTEAFLLSTLGMPSNYFDPSYTSLRGLYDLTLDGTPYEEHGVKNLMTIMRKLDCTVETRVHGEGTTESSRRRAVGSVYGSNMGQAYTNCLNAWNATGWTNNTIGHYYQFEREQWQNGDGYSCTLAQRIRSKPKCDSIPVPSSATYDWQAYAMPGMGYGPATQTWDGVTFVNGRFLSVDSGSGSATNIAIAQWLYPGENFPWFHTPTSGQMDCQVNSLSWIFLWDFQYP